MSNTSPSDQNGAMNRSTMTEDLQDNSPLLPGDVSLDSSLDSSFLEPAHPLLTDYGPISATSYLKDNLDLLHDFSCICGQARREDNPQSCSGMNQSPSRQCRSCGRTRQTSKAFSKSRFTMADKTKQKSREASGSFDASSAADISSKPTHSASKTFGFSGQPSSGHDPFGPNDSVFLDPVVSNEGPYDPFLSYFSNDNSEADLSRAVEESIRSMKNRQFQFPDTCSRMSMDAKLNQSSSEFAGYSHHQRSRKRSDVKSCHSPSDSETKFRLLTLLDVTGRQSDTSPPYTLHGKGKGKAQTSDSPFKQIEVDDTGAIVRFSALNFDRVTDDTAATLASSVLSTAMAPGSSESQSLYGLWPQGDDPIDLSKPEIRTVQSEAQAQKSEDSLTSQNPKFRNCHSDGKSENRFILLETEHQHLVGSGPRNDLAPWDRTTHTPPPICFRDQEESGENEENKVLKSSSPPGGLKGKAKAKDSINTNTLTIPDPMQTSSTAPSLQESRSKQIDYNTLLCKVSTGTQNAAASDPTGLSSSLGDASRCVHKRSYLSRRCNSPYCSVGQFGKGWPSEVPFDVFLEIVKYISFDDFKNLRLVGKTFAKQLSDMRFQSVVFSFHPNMFAESSPRSRSILQDRSLFHTYGEKIQKFGVAFEVDLDGLYSARAKKDVATKDSFWGSYKWPGDLYPRYRQLRDLEQLADNVETLKTAMGRLTNVTDLGLSLDSGHGWLAGADQSDMAVLKARYEGRKIFKPRFAMDRNFTLAQGILFESAQKRTLQLVRQRSDTPSLPVRSFPWFKDTDYDTEAEDAKHTGASSPARAGTRTLDQLNQISPNQNAQIINLLVHYPGHPLIASPLMSPPDPSNTTHQPLYFYDQAHGVVPNAALGVPQMHPHIANALINGATSGTTTNLTSLKPGELGRSAQYPLIYNGVNLRENAGGRSKAVQSQIQSPSNFPLKPNRLTEAQAQWLLETVWAQRAFLASYVTSVVANKTILGPNVRSLSITKMSSGLLKGLADNEFWAALPRLQALMLLVLPDWRKEPVMGDESQRSGKLIAPYVASLKLKTFLEKFIAPLENISDLTVGFTSGGEHATGMLARNNHVLPAPLTSNPKDWLVVRELHISGPSGSALHSSNDASTMLIFEHVANLTLRNAWITPHMLRTFMKEHHDTSLKTLTLESISLTAKHATRVDFPISINLDDRQPKHGTSAWLQEKLPNTDCWPALLDSITPGKTFLQKKYEANLISRDELVGADGDPPAFRGNIDRIILKSCGYVYITAGVDFEEFNQLDLYRLDVDPLDPGLRLLHTALEAYAMYLGEPVVRANAASEDNDNDGAHQNTLVNINTPNNHTNDFAAHTISRLIGNGAIQNNSATGPPLIREYWPLMGKIVQAIHPMEKRVLEMGFGMKFGWGESLARWGPVEDGCFEGGTGRFSGVIKRDE